MKLTAILVERKYIPGPVTISKAILLLLPFVILMTLLNFHLLLSSALTYTYHPGSHVQSIRPINPATLIRTADPNLRWRIPSDSFPFSVTIPRLIQGVTVRARLQPGTVQYVTFDAATKGGGVFSTIVSSTFLDTLKWTSITDGMTTLWMRDRRQITRTISSGTGKNARLSTVTSETPVRQYLSIAEFRSSPPDSTTVATAGLDRLAFASVANYHPNISPITITQTFRGNHQLYLYAADEDLHIAFDKIDLNRAKGPDSMTVRIARADRLTSDSRTWLKTVSVPDDGNMSANGTLGTLQHVDMVVPAVTPGIYLIDIVTNADVVFTHLTSWQHYLSFNGRVYLADGPAYNRTGFADVQILTSGSSVTVAANHEQGEQVVTIGAKKLAIKDVKIDHPVQGLSGLTTFTLAKGDAIISSDGLLTLGPAQLIPDGVHPLDVSTTPDVSSIDYIVANYRPRSKGDIKVEKTYNLTDLALNGKTLSFAINTPGLQSTGATLGLKDLQVTMIRGPFPWHKIWQKLHLEK